MTQRFVDDYLFYQIAILSHSFSSSFHEYLRKQGVSPSRWRILLNLTDIQGMYIKELAHHTCFEQSRITKSISLMQNEGLVSKTIDSRDKRRVFVSITNKGKKYIAPHMETAKAYEKQMLAQLPNEEQKKLKEILANIVSIHIPPIEAPKS